MALEHHDRAVELRHIQAKIIGSDLFIGRVRENLSRRQRSQYVSVISAAVVKHHHHYSNGVRVSKRERETQEADLIAAHSVTVENAHFLIFFSGHVIQALVSLHITDLEEDGSHILDTVKQRSRMNKHSHVSVSVSNMLNYPKLIAHGGGGVSMNRETTAPIKYTNMRRTEEETDYCCHPKHLYTRQEQ